MNGDFTPSARRVLLAAASALVISAAVGTAANAQVAESEPEASTEISTVTSGPSLVDEIVVTARRREERVQDAPVSVTSISAASLEARGVDSPTELAQVTPGLNMVASGVYSQPVVRGVSSTSVVPGDEANVPIYIDGVYMSQMSSNFFKFNNIERVEVLKGPQGTLFGRNATGGAITIITKDPSYTPTGKISVGIGNFESSAASAYFSTGLTDNLAADLALLYQNDEGYVDDVIRGGKIASQTFRAVRTKFKYEPRDWASFTLSADLSASDNTTTVSSQAFQGNTRGRLVDPTTPVPLEPYKAALTFAPENAVQVWGVSLRSDIDLGFANLISVTAYRDEISKSVTDTDASAVNLAGAIARIPAETWTQEFQLNSSADSTIQWVVGVFGLSNTTAYDPLVVFPSMAQTLAFVNTSAVAAFGELTYPFTERLSVTAGLRYSRERKVNYGRLSSGATPRFEAKWEDWTPRLIVKYQVPDALNVYASYSKGFKSGQFNSTTLSGVAVEPETLNAYEVGVKTLYPGRWRGSVAAYRYDYEDIQISSRRPTAVLPQLDNAASARIQGIEFNGDGRLTDELTISLGVSLIDGEYTDFPNANVTIPRTAVDPTPSTACVQGTGPLVGGNRGLICDVTGSKMIRTPEWTVSLSGTYIKPLAGGELDASANLYVSDSFYFDPLNRLEQPSYTVVNSKIGWTLPDGRTRIGVWGENLTDELYALVLTTSANADWVNYAKPRSYGVELSYSF